MESRCFFFVAQVLLLPFFWMFCVSSFSNARNEDVAKLVEEKLRSLIQLLGDLRDFSPKFSYRFAFFDQKNLTFSWGYI